MATNKYWLPRQFTHGYEQGPDASDTRFGATDLTLGEDLYGDFKFVKYWGNNGVDFTKPDTDVYAIDLVEGGEYNFKLLTKFNPNYVDEGLTATRPRHFQLQAPTGEVLVDGAEVDGHVAIRSSFVNDETREITFTAPSTGTYYLSAQGHGLHGATPGLADHRYGMYKIESTVISEPTPKPTKAVKTK